MPYSEPKVSPSRKRAFVAYGVGLLPGIAALVAGLQMYLLAAEEQLWGIRPLILLLGGWTVVVLLRQDYGRSRLLGWSSATGVLLGIAFAPYGAVWAPVLGFAALLVLVDRLRAARATKKQALWYAFHAMVLFNVVSTWWVANTALAAGIVANFLNALFQALVVLLIFQSAKHLARYWLASAVALWIGFEYLHFNWQIAWPWLCLGHTFAPAPLLAQWFAWTGVFGGSLYVTLSGALLYGVYSQPRSTRRRLATAFAVISLFPPLSSLTFVQVGRGTWDMAGRPVRVAAVQPNYEPHYRKFEVSRSDQLLRFEGLTAEALADGAQLIVYPETSFGGVDEGSIQREPLLGMWEAVSATVQRDVSLITGLSSYRRLSAPNHDPALRTQSGPGNRTAYYIAHNSALALGRDSEQQLYYKSKLVPGVEFLPYRKLLFFFEPLVASLGGTTAGLGRSDSAEVFALNDGIRAAPLICYESIYGDYVREFVQRGANLLVVPTNDGWWDDSPGYRQHFNLARLRAIETRRYVVQAANSGTSGFIDPLGRAYAKTEYDVATVTSHDVELLEGETPYVRWGDWIGMVMSVGAVVTLASLSWLAVVGKRGG